MLTQLYFYRFAWLFFSIAFMINLAFSIIFTIFYISYRELDSLPLTIICLAVICFSNYMMIKLCHNRVLDIITVMYIAISI